jgi:SRSO17 transposase
MDRRFETRKRELLDDCKVSPQVFEGMLDRLRPFAQPFLDCLGRSEQRDHGRTYLSGLLSDLERKNTEAIANRFDQDRRGLQNFLGVSTWDHDPLLEELARQVGRELADPNAVLVFDPSGFAKKGDQSVGVARQWLGRLGKVDNGQVGIYLAYVSATEHALVDVRLYLPKEWAQDKKRCANAGVPAGTRYRTRHDLALDMLRSRGPLLPHGWVAGDDEMGRSSRFRHDLRQAGERYLLAVPSNTTVRDLDAPAPAWSGRGRRPKRRFEQVQDWAKAVPDGAWTRVDVRDGEKGPVWVELVATRVQARTDTRAVGPDELLVVIRSPDESGGWKYDYYLSNADRQTPLADLARVANAEHRVEECLKRAKSEAGLADYEVRSWEGWHHHQTLSMVACWFLVKEALRGKPLAPAITVPQIRRGLALLIDEACGPYTPERLARATERQEERNELARFYHWKKHNRLPPRRLRPCG